MIGRHEALLHQSGLYLFHLLNVWVFLAVGLCAKPFAANEDSVLLGKVLVTAGQLALFRVSLGELGVATFGAKTLK